MQRVGEWELICIWKENLSRGSCGRMISLNPWPMHHEICPSDTSNHRCCSMLPIKPPGSQRLPLTHCAGLHQNTSNDRMDFPFAKSKCVRDQQEHHSSVIPSHQVQGAQTDNQLERVWRIKTCCERWLHWLQVWQRSGKKRGYSSLKYLLLQNLCMSCQLHHLPGHLRFAGCAAD